MSKFIKLTHENDEPIFVNVNSIESFNFEGAYTRIHFVTESDHWYDVCETPEQILSMIEAQQYTEADMISFAEYFSDGSQGDAAKALTDWKPKK